MPEVGSLPVVANRTLPESAPGTDFNSRSWADGVGFAATAGVSTSSVPASVPQAPGASTPARATNSTGRAFTVPSSLELSGWDGRNPPGHLCGTAAVMLPLAAVSLPFQTMPAQGRAELTGRSSGIAALRTPR